jgi:hypothetical protein
MHKSSLRDGDGGLAGWNISIIVPKPTLPFIQKADIVSILKNINLVHTAPP